MVNRNMIWVTVEKEGFHYWPEAPIEVSFLRRPHRHIFKFKIYINILHNDREIEFFIFKKFIEKCIENIWTVNGLYSWNRCKPMSCEMIGDELSIVINKKYPKRNMMIEVSEDGENGSYQKYEFES